VPELAEVVGLLIVEGVFEGSVAVPQLLEEVVLGGHGVKVERLTWGEDDDLFREITVVRIV
jgi:hypothetical protein